MADSEQGGKTRFDTSQAQETSFPAHTPGNTGSSRPAAAPRGVSSWILIALGVALVLLFLYWLL